MTEEEKRIVNLYGLLEELEEEGRTEEAGNLRWHSLNWKLMFWGSSYEQDRICKMQHR